MVWLLMGSSLAATLTVTSGTSIQTTINSATSGDTINIEAGTYSECLSFGGKNLSFVGAGTVIIDGSGCGSTATATVSGSENISFSTLEMENPNGLVIDADSISSTVSLDYVTIESSGYSAMGPTNLGGVIYSTGAVVIDNSTFSFNAGGLGGVIYMEDGTLSISNSTFDSNSALKGGVLYAREGTEITSYNNLYDGNFSVGSFGGVFSLLYTVSYTDDSSVYQNNSSDGHGGVFYALHDVNVNTPNEIAISNGYFDGNGSSQSISSGKGGVFYLYERSTLTVTNTEFVDNTSSGGGVAWIVNADDAATFDNCSFDSNFSDGGAGGAIGVRGTSSAPTDLDIQSSVFIDNLVEYAGGGAIAIGSSALLQQYGSLNISGSSFQNNETTISNAGHGGAIFVITSSSDDVTISNSTFEGNTAYVSGGAIYIDGTDQILIELSTFLDNAASSAASYNHFGGAIFINDSSDVEVSNSIFCGNEVNQYSSSYGSTGGGFYVQNTPDVSVHNTVFQENLSLEGGGGLAGDTVSTFHLKNNTFVGNSSPDGAGFWLVNTPTAYLKNNILAHSTGSGAHADDATTGGNSLTYSGWWQNTTNVSGFFSMTSGVDGNLTVDPEFQAYSADGDCSNELLSLATTSPYIDAGDPNIYDNDGSRSDIGAFGGPDLEDSDGDGFSALIDCDDTNANAYPGAAENESLTACREDADGDGYGSTAPSSSQIEAGTDCDDSLILVNPIGTEFCDGIDNDCNGSIDDNPVGGTSYYLDADSDGFGENTATQACTAGANYVEISGDCNDLDPYTYPGVAFNDSSTTCMQDHDQDGFGHDAPSISGITAGTDCDDTQPAVNTNASELPGDGADSNCDGNEDCYQDGDGDGYGGSSTQTSASLSCSGLGIALETGDCDDSDQNAFPGSAEIDSLTACMLDADGDGYGSLFAPSGGISGNDCDDSDPNVYYGAPEIPGDGISQDCDNSEDCYADADGDGFGTATIIASSDRDCDDAGESGDADDCDDTDSDISPDAAEVLYDGIDNDCDATTSDDDLDGDGYGVSDGDCDDEDVTINPGAEEIFYDDIDNDCDPLTDDDDADGDGLTELDGDCDDSDASINPNMEDIPDDGIDQDCDGSDATSDDADGDGFTVEDGDCDDADASINPGAEDTPGDGVDQDCDGIDAGDEDIDGDGFTENDGDCDDYNSSVYPGAEEIADGIDNDCDSFIDEDVYVDKVGCFSSDAEASFTWFGLAILFLGRRRKV